MGLSMEFLNGWRSDAEMGHNVDREPLCLPMTSDLMAEWLVGRYFTLTIVMGVQTSHVMLMVLAAEF